MPDKRLATGSPVDLRENALSRWDNEGGARVDSPDSGENPPGALPETPALTHSELVQLRVRVIALENVVIALLAHGSEDQRRVALEMAAYILPRPGVTHHPLTLHASALMIGLVRRADSLRPEHS